MNIKKLIISSVLLTLTFQSKAQQYHMPEETELHEGTWLQWPHHYSYGTFYRNSLDQTWVNMTEALVTSEKVHIVAYNQSQEDRITGLLMDAGISLDNIDFTLKANDDVWVRDNGPMFVYDENDDLKILDWGFNGWGNDTPYSLCDVVPAEISNQIGVDRIDLSAMVLEGGAIEHDGSGTMMATRSSVTHTSRNPNLTETEIEAYLSQYVGINNFIWLDGEYGVEITDMHIDGFVKFAGNNTLLTMNSADLDYWGVSAADKTTLSGATNSNGDAFTFVEVPLTATDVSTETGTNLGYKGSYINYYIGNTVVLVPNYNDVNDVTANAIIQSVYPNRTVVGIDVRNLYENGGMIHCVTQQQPVSLTTTTSSKSIINKEDLSFNVLNDQINFESEKGLLQIYTMEGKRVMEELISQSGRQSINIQHLSNGVYIGKITTDSTIYSGKISLKK